MGPCALRALCAVDSECLGPDVAVSTRKGMRGTPVCSTRQCPWESQHFHIAVVQQNIDDIGLCGMWTTIVYTSLPCLPIIGKYIMQIVLESTKHCIIRSYIELPNHNYLLLQLSLIFSAPFLTPSLLLSSFPLIPFKLFAAKSSLDDPVIEDELMSSAATSAASSRRESYCSSEGDGRWRRRSSTSDVLRFRHRMQQMSSHESHEEIPNPEETNKQDDQTSTRTRTEPSITITTASMSSQESSVGLSKPSRVMSSVEDSTGSGRTTASSSAASSSHFNQHHQADTVPTTLAASSDSQLEPQASPDVGHSVIENTTYDL